jgi:long-chain fatty acid transport protein
MRRAPLLLLLLAAPAAASPLEMFGFGGRSPALAATGVAAADDYECLYLNPAGLAEVRRRKLSAGLLFGTFSLQGSDRVVDDAVGVEVGAAFPLPLGGALRDRVGLGFAIYVPTALLNRARAPLPGTPFYALLENRSEVVGVQIGGGIRIGDNLDLGAGVLVLGGLTGSIDVAPDAAGRFATTSEQQLVASYAPIAGARYHLSPKLTVGAAFRGRSESTYDIRIMSDLGEALPVTIPPLKVAGIAQFDPMTVAAEAAWRPRPSLLLSGQLAWEHWSAFPNPTENPVSTMPPQKPPGFHDTVVPRLGIEWRHGDLALRGGYAFVLSPAPDVTGTQVLLDNHRNVLSAGAGYVLGALHIDLWMQAHLLLARHRDEPSVDTGGTIFVGGLMLGVDL